MRPAKLTTGGAVTFVVTAALVLFAAFVSFAAVAVAVLEMFPVTVTETVARIVTTAVSLGLSVGMVTDAVLPVADTVPAVVPPIVEVPDTNVNPAGKTSLTAMLVAVEGPEFVTLSV
jgi:hypothetical protein